MALIKSIPETWTELTLAADETWQCRAGSVLLNDTDTPVDDDDGLRLDLLVAKELKAGDIVSYRRFGGTPAIIARVAL